LYILYKATQKEQPTQIINRAIPTATTTSIVDTRDPYRVQAFQQLASLAGVETTQATNLQLAGLSLQAEQMRQNTALAIDTARQATQIELARIGGNTLIEQARISALQRQYDVEAQLRALQQTQSAQNRAGLQSGILQTLGNILNAMGRGGSGSGGSGSGGSGSSGSFPIPLPRRRPSIPVPNVGPFTPPFVPNFGANFSDPFQSGWYGNDPYGYLDFYPDDYFSNIPLLPRGEGSDPFIYGYDDNWWGDDYYGDIWGQRLPQSGMNDQYGWDDFVNDWFGGWYGDWSEDYYYWD
jgi:hypothetical protein